LTATHGVMIGEVRPDSALIWARAGGEGFMHVRVRLAGEKHWKSFTLPVQAEHDFTGKLGLVGLQPGTGYRYQVWFTGTQETQAIPLDAVEGEFTTPPKANQPDVVTFAWGGDLGGQNVCRDRQQGYPIFQAIHALELDFFLGLGDMIYADGICEATGHFGNIQTPGDFPQAARLDEFWAHWKYNRADPGLQRLLKRVPYYAVWDDHEVLNDFGPQHDTRDTPPYTPGHHLLPIGLAAFLDYHPIENALNHPQRLYRHFRWGKHLEVFLLDTRQHRDANLAKDDPGQPKTLLGREQLNWLKQRLGQSDATWKIIISSVPLAIPSGSPERGRDGWANLGQDTGFERELLDILRFMRDQSLNNTVWLTTDVHFAQVLRYTPFPANPSFRVHEFVAGPLSAGLFPKRDLDPTLNPQSLFFYGPKSTEAITTYEQAKPWFNFGYVAVNAQGSLRVEIRNVTGEVVYQTTLASQ
jgi:alkaline phosphatase D